MNYSLRSFTVQNIVNKICSKIMTPHITRAKIKFGAKNDAIKFGAKILGLKLGELGLE